MSLEKSLENMALANKKINIFPKFKQYQIKLQK